MTAKRTHAAAIAALAGVSWIALGLDSIIRPAPLDARDTFWMLPFTLTGAAFYQMHRAQRSRSRRFERLAFLSVVIASALAFCGNIGIQLRQPSLAVLGFPWGAIIWTVGLIAFGVATLRARVFPRWAAIAVILLEPGSILTGLALSPLAPLQEHGAYSAGVEKGAVLLLIAAALGAVNARQPAPAAVSRIASTTSAGSSS